MNDIRISVIGLGYVGLPLACLFANKYPVIGFDINKDRVSKLMSGVDGTLEISEATLKSVIRINENDAFKNNGLYCTGEIEQIKECNYYIITVPTPVDKNNRPDLSPLIKASQIIATVISKGDYVIFESTVYPGATEENCIPVIENISKLKLNKDFFVGYSPERINPGDKNHTVEKIKKVTSGSNIESAINIDKLYKSVIIAGTHLAPSIKVAEAAKVIENCQRDINIAFVNELAKIFHLMNIDTHEVLEAAGSKWNFLPFKPGLVGGHCIGVDPFYLAQKAQEFGYHPEIILTGRRLNDSMGGYVANQIIKLMIKKGNTIKSQNVLILGFTFKENCPDIRNTKVIDIYNELVDFGTIVHVYDPWVNPEEIKREYGIDLISSIQCLKKYKAIILAVGHDEFKNINLDIIKDSECIVYDVKGFYEKNNVDERL
jgi:UDP-N-acetyl-D-galactosamine dehydrogenase